MVVPHRVMVIDDSETDLLYTQVVLERGLPGCRIDSFESAREALEQLRAGPEPPVRLILLDINMPGMNGFEFLEAYEALARPPGGAAIVVMLSSSPLQADRERAMAYRSVRSYVTKPIDREAVRSLGEMIGT